MKQPHRVFTPKTTWQPARSMAARVFRPLERFLQIEAASGIVLLMATLAALVWANSPWASSYERIWRATVRLGMGRLVFTESIHFWINDGLMVIFFFVAGLEIRREIHCGELSDARRASLPLVAALGGMLAPAMLYIAMNRAEPFHRGWGVPMATDIAFAVGVLALLGKRVPPALRVLLLALAIIDDVGAIVVIALFYSSGLSWLGLAIAAAGTAGVVVLQRLGVRRSLVYVLPGAVIWLGMLRAGIHPTIAGVLLGLLTPVRPWVAKQQNDQLDDVSRELISPVVRLEAALHGWVAFGIMPLFAFANAGVDLRGLSLSEPGSKTVLFGVVVGLVLGKPLGILLASYLAVRLRISALPVGIHWKSILVLGSVAGIGFTMAIFVAGLAFPNTPILAAAKLGVLLASFSAALIGLFVGRLVLRVGDSSGAAQSVDEAEASTDL